MDRVAKHWLRDEASFVVVRHPHTNIGFNWETFVRYMYVQEIVKRTAIVAVRLDMLLSEGFIDHRWGITPTLYSASYAVSIADLPCTRNFNASGRAGSLGSTNGEKPCCTTPSGTGVSWRA